MIYDLLAPFYDEINSDISYSDWADFIEKIIADNMKNKPELVLDLGCGTGSMALELASRGYDMTGVDYSSEMLDVARTRAEEEGADILWLCQDMRELELYGTVDLTVCCLDAINHLTDEYDLDKCFKLVHNYLIPDGLFVFDVNGKHKFENVYSTNSYVMENDGAMCVWQNYYDEESELCDFYITLFKEEGDGRYCRYDEEQTERMYTSEVLRDRLTKAGFEVLGEYGGFDFEPVNESTDRIYMVARCKK